MWPRPSLLGPAPVVARTLLGAVLQSESLWGTVRGRIVETEAYDPHDAASHSYRGITPRTAPMFGPPGHAYIYRSYGIHLCLNITCGPRGVGAAVLIRALEPLDGLTVMARLRGLEAPFADPTTAQATTLRLCRGPGNVAQALGLQLQQTGEDVLLHSGKLRLLRGTPVADDQVAATGRIGIRVAQDVPWRFFMRQSRFVSASRRA